MKRVAFPNVQQLICNNNHLTGISGVDGMRLEAVDFSFNNLEDILAAKSVLLSLRDTLRKVCFSKNPIASDAYYVFHLIDACRSLTHVDNHELEESLVVMLKFMALENNLDGLSDKLNTFYTNKIEEVFAKHEQKRLELLAKEHDVEVSFGEQLHNLNSAVHGVINYIVEKSKQQKDSIDETKYYLLLF
jgi:hypothetical protein